ncbi:MAG: hypothetical protein ABFR31_12755, partial [Thermodesulfobacteriota bacterium]
MKLSIKIMLLCIFFLVSSKAFAGGGHDTHQMTESFPPLFESYHDSHLQGVGEILIHRIKQVPFNLAATII